MSIRVGKTSAAPGFPVAAKTALGDSQLRRNVAHATNVIRGKRAMRVEEMPDWQELRQAASDIKAHTLAHLDYYLVEFERNPHPDLVSSLNRFVDDMLEFPIPP